MERLLQDKMNKIIFIILIIFLFGCSQNADSGIIQKINEVNDKYGTTMESFPASVEMVDDMLKDFKSIKEMDPYSKFDDLLDFRIKTLEAGKLYLKGTRYGNMGTTSQGFGCKSRAIIIESANLRNQSSQISFEAVNILLQVLKDDPEIAEQFSLTGKTALLQNATAYSLFETARKDIKTMNNLCPQNKTLELYKEELRAKMDLGDEYINKLEYDEAALLWRQLRGYE